MADQLYLSLWFPNFRLQSLPATLTSVLRQFAAVAGDTRVRAASAYPIDFTESPTYQRIFVTDDRAAETPDTTAAQIDIAIAEATEQLHDDMAYEFEMAWNLWLPDPTRAEAAKSAKNALADDPDERAHSEKLDAFEESFADAAPRQPIPFRTRGRTASPEALWQRRPATVRILGFGPEFDAAGYAQNGHIRVDFGLDTPWTFETTLETLAPKAPTTVEQAIAPSGTLATHIQQNVEMLLAFTLLVEKNCNLSSRLLWTESGEPLAEKLIATLQRLH